MSRSKAVLTRLSSTDGGTFGRLTFNNFSCYSGELSDRSNQASISCIPKGVYLAQATYSPRFKRQMIEVKNVPHRAGIRIHSANFMGDKSKGYKCQLNGCIAIGYKLGTMDGQPALLLSAPATRQFESLVGTKEFELEIK